MSQEVSRRSVLGVASVAAATVGAGMALAACSSDEDTGTSTGDSSTMFARIPQRNPLQGKVLLHDTFDDGFDGWRDHYNGSGPCPPLSLTSYPVFSGSHALMIGCSAAPDDGYADGWQSGTNAAAFKNLSRYYDGNLVTLSCYLAHGSDATTAALGGYWLMVDTQSWDNSRRAFFKLMVNRDAASGQRSLSIANNEAKPVRVYNGTDLFSGDNENKFNFDWISLTVDLDANNGLGGYHSCQVNNRAYDLTGLAGQSAKESPQQGGAMASFAGGLNFGVLLYPGPAGSGESFLVIDQVVASVDEVGK
jgi:hypothetical protein